MPEEAVIFEQIQGLYQQDNIINFKEDETPLEYHDDSQMNQPIVTRR